MPKKKVRSDDHKMTRELKKTEFRVTIFGSARIKPEDKIYKMVFKLAKEIGKQGFDVVTGGGPGLMEAANAGHAAGDKEQKADNIGLTIQLPWEARGNKHLEIKKHFNKFSDRLDHFMALSRAVVIMPGGIGTCLEFFYTLQLIQVKHIKPIPIILVSPMWKNLYKWIEKNPVKNGLASPKDLKCIHYVKTPEEAMKMIMKEYKKFQKEGKKRNTAEYLDK